MVKSPAKRHLNQPDRNQIKSVLTPDNSEVAVRIHGGQRTNSRESVTIITPRVNFLTYFFVYTVDDERGGRYKIRMQLSYRKPRERYYFGWL
jgi:hypothetical protein